MKNCATNPDPTAAAWASGLQLFDRDLRRRGAAERTRRAYGADLQQLATWAIGQELAPEDVGYRELRRFVAT
ncbi:MAG: tyrosine recombinase XerC, partial [Actinomycetes bacterium]